jgi:hypothetical protein
MFGRFIAALLIAGLSGCGSDSSGPTTPAVPQDVNGTWVGTAPGTPPSTVSLTLATQGSTVTGSGQFAQGTISIALIVASGTYTPPNLSLVVNAVGFSQLNFTGQRTQNLLTGLLNGSGFSNQAITLSKQ